MPPLLSFTGNYPPDLENLTLWSKRLFAVYYSIGCAGSLLLAAGIVLAFTGSAFTLMLVLLASGLLLLLASAFLTRFMSEVDRRRYQLISTGRDSFE